MNNNQNSQNKQDNDQEKVKVVPNLYELNKIKNAANQFSFKKYGNNGNQVKGGIQFRINQHKGA